MARTKKEGTYRFLNVQIREEVLEKLSAYSEMTRIPKTAITEIALKEYLDRVMPTEKKGEN